MLEQHWGIEWLNYAMPAYSECGCRSIVFCAVILLCAMFCLFELFFSLHNVSNFCLIFCAAFGFWSSFEYPSDLLFFFPFFFVFSFSFLVQFPKYVLIFCFLQSHFLASIFFFKTKALQKLAVFEHHKASFIEYSCYVAHCMGISLRVDIVLQPFQYCLVALTCSWWLHCETIIFASARFPLPTQGVAVCEFNG